jgi:predicted RecA/RadA family phage recombinase
VAKNRVFAQSHQTLPLEKAIAQTAARTSNGALSGDPVRIGQIPGVALIDADSSQRTVVQKDGVFTLLVAGIDSSGVSAADANVAVNGGDALYFDEAKTPPLSKRAGGVFFGYALGDSGVQVVASGGLTTAIPVQVGR